MIELKKVKLPLRQPVISREPIVFYEGELACLVGPSGSGKTTFLYLLGLLDETVDCIYRLNGRRIHLKSERAKARVRRFQIGYVFQDHQLIEHLNVSENLRLSARLASQSLSDEEISQWLERMQLKGLSGKEKLDTLSGGQRQRVAIAAALVKRPVLLILDEPTSALDSSNARHLVALLKQLAREEKIMIVAATHAEVVKEAADRIYGIEDHEIRCLRQKEPEQLREERSCHRYPQFSLPGYVWTYFRKNWKSKTLLSLLCGLVIAVFLVSTVVADQIVGQQEDMMTQLSNTEIILTNDLAGQRYQKDAPVLSQEDVDYLESLNYVAEILPFSIQTTSLDGMTETVEIQPYTMRMSEAQFADEEGIYISYALHERLGSVSSIEVDGERLEIAGYLDSVHTNRYGQFELVIYLPKSLFDERYPATSTSSMYLIYADKYSAVYQLRTQIQSHFQNSYVNCEYVAVDEIRTSIEATANYMRITSIALYLIVLLMLMIIYSRYIVNREGEFCLLRANGLTKKAIFQLVVWDIFFQSLFFFLASVIDVLLTSIVLIQLGILGSFEILPLLGIGYVTSLGILILPSVISLVKVNQFTPAAYFRR